MEDSSLASLSLTHVHYDPSDPISYLCAYLALVPHGLVVVYATLVWSTREIEILLMFAGQAACEVFNLILKRLLKEERPKMMHGRGYGMPSSHAQFVAFFSTSFALFLLLRHTPRAASASHTPLSLATRMGVSGLALACAATVASSRVYLNYHTPKQVLVGCLAGVGSAMGWFLITTVARQVGLVQWGLNLYIMRFFRVRDLVVEEDLSQAGWEKWEAKRITAPSAKKKR